MDLYYRPQTSLRRLYFYRCLSFCPQGRGMGGCSGGACMVAQGGVHGCSGGTCVVALGGHVWFYLGGMRGFIWGACMVLFGGWACVVLFGGHAWFYLGGHAWFYSGGHAWFYSGGMHGFIWGGVRVFFSFSDTMRYGQWAGGMHPTGMHSCWWLVRVTSVGSKGGRRPWCATLRPKIFSISCSVWKILAKS